MSEFLTREAMGNNNAFAQRELYGRVVEFDLGEGMKVGIVSATNLTGMFECGVKGDYGHLFIVPMGRISSTCQLTNRPVATIVYQVGQQYPSKCPFTP